jgi:ABC-type multidrug transport system ATPase subunit
MGGFPALAGADLDVNEGETVLLSGPNGAGKSTLLRLVAGLVPLRAGSATVLGTDLTRDRRRHRRRLALVGHDTFCYDDLTVGENARFAAAASGSSHAAAAAAIDRLRLTPHVDVRYGRLSAGQRRRLAIAVAIAREPRLLLLDEPHAGLDSEGRELLDEIVRRAPSEGVTTMIASHEVERARPLATREVRVDAGLVHGGAVADSPAAAAATAGAVPAALGAVR